MVFFCHKEGCKFLSNFKLAFLQLILWAMGFNKQKVKLKSLNSCSNHSHKQYLILRFCYYFCVTECKHQTIGKMKIQIAFKSFSRNAYGGVIFLVLS